MSELCLLKTLLTPNMWVPSSPHIQPILQYQLGILQFNSLLTLSAVRAHRLGAQSPKTALTSEASWRSWVLCYHASGVSEHRGLILTLAMLGWCIQLVEIPSDYLPWKPLSHFCSGVWQSPWALQERDVPTTFSRGARHKASFQRRERLPASKGFLCFSSTPPSSFSLPHLPINSWELLPCPWI